MTSRGDALRDTALEKLGKLADLNMLDPPDRSQTFPVWDRETGFYAYEISTPPEMGGPEQIYELLLYQRAHADCERFKIRRDARRIVPGTLRDRALRPGEC